MIQVYHPKTWIMQPPVDARPFVKVEDLLAIHPGLTPKQITKTAYNGPVTPEFLNIPGAPVAPSIEAPASVPEVIASSSSKKSKPAKRISK
jgi:hypothetical protein